MAGSPVKAESYRVACRDYEERWTALDEALYGLCKQYTDHSTRNAIYAKLWIVGRAYATGIERKGKSTGVQGGVLEQLAEYLFENRSAIDSTLGRLANVHEPLALDTLETIVQVHGQLVNLLKKSCASVKFRGLLHPSICISIVQ